MSSFSPRSSAQKKKKKKSHRNDRSPQPEKSEPEFSAAIEAAIRPQSVPPQLISAANRQKHQHHQHQQEGSLDGSDHNNNNNGSRSGGAVAAANGDAAGAGATAAGAEIDNNAAGCGTATAAANGATADAAAADDSLSTASILDSIKFRRVRPTDIPECYRLEKSSYPSDEAASKSALQYRQHHAERFFRCAVLTSGPPPKAAAAAKPPPSQSAPSEGDNHDATGGASSGGSVGSAADLALLSGSEEPTAAQQDDGGKRGGEAAAAADTATNNSPNDDADEDHNSDARVVGFICATRCKEFAADAMSTHLPGGPLLAVHSVVVAPEFRRMGVATAMMRNYVSAVEKMNDGVVHRPVDKMVLLAKKQHLTFYVHCGFQVTRPSPILHGQELWYELERRLPVPPASQKNKKERGVPCYVVDAFAEPESPGTGNPAAVVLLDIDGDGDGDGSDDCNKKKDATAQQAASLARRASDDGSTASKSAAAVTSPSSSGTAAASPDDEGGGSDEDVRRRWMQLVAAEFNLSETAFLTRRRRRRKQGTGGGTGQDTAAAADANEDGDGASTVSVADDNIEEDDSGEDDEVHFNIRYFTPTTEVPLCGHATLASAAALFRSLREKEAAKKLVFHAQCDVLRAFLAPPGVAQMRRKQQQRLKVTMEFPVKAATELHDDDELNDVKKMVESALSIDSENDILYVGHSDEIGDVIIELTVESFLGIGHESVNHDAFRKWDGYSRGIIICCCCSDGDPDVKAMLECASAASTGGGSTAEDDNVSVDSAPGTRIDFMSRFFAPKAGIDEDPVTGSAHCVLAPYFCEKLGKHAVVGKQMSLRGGVVECEMVKKSDDDEKASIVRMTGTAVTAVSGTLWL